MTNPSSERRYKFNLTALSQEDHNRIFSVPAGQDKATVYGRHLLAITRDLTLMRGEQLWASMSAAILLIDGGADVNMRDALTGRTALHNVAGCSCRPVIRALVASNRCDYLIQDAQNFYASGLAIKGARDYAVANLLGKHQVRQAAERGVPSRVSPPFQAGLAGPEPV